MHRSPFLVAEADSGVVRSGHRGMNTHTVHTTSSNHQLGDALVHLLSKRSEEGKMGTTNTERKADPEINLVSYESR